MYLNLYLLLYLFDSVVLLEYLVPDLLDFRIYGLNSLLRLQTRVGHWFSIFSYQSVWIWQLFTMPHHRKYALQSFKKLRRSDNVGIRLNARSLVPILKNNTGRMGRRGIDILMRRKPKSNYNRKY